MSSITTATTEFIQNESDNCCLNNSIPTTTTTTATNETNNFVLQDPTNPLMTTTNSSLSIKTQMVPLVYIQTPPKFTPLPKTNNNNLVVPQIQFATITSNSSVNNQTANQVILTPIQKNAAATTTKTQQQQQQTQQQQLVIHKPPNSSLPVVSSVSKIACGAYLTMLKQIPTTTSDLQFNLQQQQQQQSVMTATTPSTTNTLGLGQKFVIAPMPKVIKNHRLPVTVTTNSLQPKIAFMPITLPSTSSSSTTSSSTSNPDDTIFNIKITNGQVQENVVVNNKSDEEVKLACEQQQQQERMICDDEIINLDSPIKNENKEYELSIVEDLTPQPLKELKSMTTTTTTTNAAKRGVSILKKNHQFYFEPKIVYHNNNNISSLVLDPAPDNKKDIVETKINKPQKTERRRKSNFSYRKDYNDMQIIIHNNNNNNTKDINHINSKFENTDITLTKLTKTNKENDDFINKNSDFIDIELIKEKPVGGDSLNMNGGCFDFKKILKWDDGIGSLPGSDIKFIINEFDIVEFVTKDEYNKIIENKLKMKNEFQEEMRCLECGCYGLPSEFINPKYCSYDCQENGKNKELKEKEMKLKRNNNNHNKRKKSTKKTTLEIIAPAEIIKTENETNNNNNNNNNNSDDDCNNLLISSNENSQDMKNGGNPRWKCAKKGFSWTKYLEYVKSKGAPQKLFKDPFPYNRNCFRPGMKLEGIDPQHPSYFCVLSVSEICGYRVRLHFDGYPNNYDFWVNADSMDIFPPGWCEKYGHVLHPPPGYTIDNFNWIHYLKNTKSIAAPKPLFANRAGNAICPNGFRVGMKLEAVDRKNTSLVCVATIKDMMGNRILVHFDSWDDIYDYWADPTSPYIHPVGWCDQYGHNLTPPNDYPSPETFSWNKYLKETKSVAAPVRAFKQRPVCGFRSGMRLECVDKRVPQFIRVATVDEIKEHQLLIKFDGWLDRYNYWVDDDSPDIHPVGWCQKTGHPLETPLAPSEIYEFLDCPTIGCKGIGHTGGLKYSTHSEQKYCPYAEGNIDVERVLPDRLLSPDRLIEAVVPVQREPKDKIKPKMGRSPKCPRIEPKIEEEDDDDDADNEEEEQQQQQQHVREQCEPKKPKRQYKKRKLDIHVDKKLKLEALEFIEKSKMEPAEKETWQKHSQFLNEFLINVNNNPKEWSSAKVSNFVSTIPGCESEGFIFELQEIDGDAFLSLNQKDLLDLLKMKVGPAVKLYNIIVLLRNSCNGLMFSS